MNPLFHKVSVCVDEIQSSNYALLLQDSSGLKLWKRRWFVLSNYCLFYYKGTRHLLVVHQRVFCSRHVYVFIVPYQTVEKRLLWAASPFQAIKSCSAHPENARTGSSPSRYTHLRKTVENVKLFKQNEYVFKENKFTLIHIQRKQILIEQYKMK